MEHLPGRLRALSLFSENKLPAYVLWQRSEMMM